jgi:hydrogenase maturation protease
MNAYANDVRAMVVGYGNPLRGDDGVGWVAAQKIAQTVDPALVAALGMQQLTPEMAEPISRMDLVIFIDAAQESEPGQIHSVSVGPGPAVATPASITHELTPQRLLRMARSLYGRWPQAYLFTVSGADFGFSQHLSDEVEQACERLVKEVLAILDHSFQNA